MKKTITQTRSKVQTQANDLLQGLPCKLEELGTLSLIQFGSEAILRAAILEEIRSYLGRERYEHIEASGKAGYRNGDRHTAGTGHLLSASACGSEGFQIQFSHTVDEAS